MEQRHGRAAGRARILLAGYTSCGLILAIIGAYLPEPPAMSSGGLAMAAVSGVLLLVSQRTR